MKIFASKRWLAACLLMLALLVTAGCQEGQGTSSSSGSSGVSEIITGLSYDSPVS